MFEKLTLVICLFTTTPANDRLNSELITGERATFISRLVEKEIEVSQEFLVDSSTLPERRCDRIHAH